MLNSIDCKVGTFQNYNVEWEIHTLYIHVFIHILTDVAPIRNANILVIDVTVIETPADLRANATRSVAGSLFSTGERLSIDYKSFHKSQVIKTHSQWYDFTIVLNYKTRCNNLPSQSQTCHRHQCQVIEREWLDACLRKTILCKNRNQMTPRVLIQWQPFPSMKERPIIRQRMFHVMDLVKPLNSINRIICRKTVFNTYPLFNGVESSKNNHYEDQ